MVSNNIKLTNPTMYASCIEQACAIFHKNKYEYANLPLHAEFPGYLQLCNGLCCHYVYNYLITPLGKNEIRTILLEQHKLALNISNADAGLYNYMLVLLEANGLLINSGGLLTFNDINNVQFNSINKLMEIKSSYPMFSGTLSLLDHCMLHYPEVLFEKIPAIQVLYPEGNVHFINQCYAQNIPKYPSPEILLPLYL